MELSQEITSILLDAEAKALASASKNDVNVVPVSSVKVVENEIWLINYFFDKTLYNIQQNPNVALTFWKGLKGYQIKAETKYITEGNKFKKATDWISEIHPNRIVKGLLVLDTVDVFDISIDNKRI
jgi:hypothetical protein